MAGFGLAGTSVYADDPQAIVPEKHLDLMYDHCMDCHNADTQKGKVNLEDLPLEVNTLQHAELWQKVLDVMNSGEMPPENKRQPEKVAKADFLEDLAKTMVLARKKLSDSGGQITMRRLNRREYHNTIESLTGVSLNVESLPADGGAGSFDTVGASQFISSDQFEQYLELGRTAIDEAFARHASMDQKVLTFRVEPENTVNVESAKWMKRLEDVHLRYLGWKAGVDKAALAPENQQALEQIRKKYNLTDLSNSIRLYQNADLLKGIPDAKNFGFKDSNDAEFSFRGGYDRMYAYQKHYAELPLSDRGTYLKLGWGIQRIVISPPADKLAPGEYKLRIRAGSVIGSDPNRHFIQIGYPQRTNQVPAGFAGKPISGHQVNGTTESPEIIETIVKIGSGNPNEFAIQERQPEDRDTYRKQFYRIKKENGYGYPPAVWIDWAELEGPIRDKQIIKTSITRVEPEKTINLANEKIIKKAEATQDRFKQWKKGVDEAAKSPENQAIIAEIRKKNRLIDHPNRFYIFAEHFKNVPNPRDFGFLDFQKAAAADPSRSKNLALLKHYASLPHRDTGTYLKLTHGTGRVIVAPKKMPVGDYIFRVRLGTVKGTPAARKFIEIGHPQRDIEVRDWGLKGKPISVHQVNGTIEAPQIMEIPIEVRSDTTREFAVQEKQPNNANLKTLWDEHNQLKAENGYGHPPAIWIDWAEIEGPIPKKPKIWKQRREVEVQANYRIKNVYEGYFKGGYETGQKFLKDGIPQPKKGVTDEREAKFRIRRFEREGPTWRRYMNDPLTQKGSLLTIFNPNKEEFIVLPPEQHRGWRNIEHEVDTLPPGTYRFRIRVGSVKGSVKSRQFLELGAVPNEGQFNLLRTLQVTGSTDNPQVLEADIQLSLNGPRKFALREKRNFKDDVLHYNKGIDETGFAPPSALWIDWVEWEGPLAPSENKTFKKRREVEHYATAKVKRKFENYFKAGYEAALAFQKDGIPRPAVGVKDLDEAKFRIRRYEMEAPSQLRYLNDPLTKTGSLLGVFDRNGNLNSEEFIEISMDPLGAPKKSKPLPLGKYRLRVRIGSIEGTSPDRHFAVLGSVSQAGSRNVGGDGFNLLETFQVTGTTTDPQVFETTVELTLDGPRKFSLREKSNLKADTLRGKREIYKNGMAAPPALWIDWVEWEGPLPTDTASAGLVSILTENRYGSKDTEEERARKMFHDFCVDAYRQVEPDPEFIDKLMGLLKIRKAAGETFDVAIRTPMSVILASPGFLYLDEPNKEESKRTLTDRELAVRLSYFLWSRPPDSELISLAQKNELSKPEILRQQVNRMITDPRSDDFVSGFVHQWLHMERLDFFQFDTKLHREFDESVRASARKEVYESFALLMRDREEGRLGKLLKSDYVMINGLLGTYYGIDGVNGDHFRKVSLPADSPRGGLLGTAAVLAMGSDGIESSPVERGAWVLRYLLNDPPPPAPPNVPQLSRLANKPLTARERVLAHQEEPQCASCHRKIDPIGFGLENFTAAGKWRTEDKHGKKTYDIDPSGKFHKGPEFADYFEMRDLIAQREDDFARGFTEHLIGYGLGRPFGFTDEDLANEITSAAKKEDHSVSAFVHALVQSKAFITK